MMDTCALSSTRILYLLLHVGMHRPDGSSADCPSYEDFTYVIPKYIPQDHSATYVPIK